MPVPIGAIPMRIAQLESQHYALQIMLFIRRKSGSYVEEMLREQFGETTRPTIYRAVWLLSELGLIRNELTDSESGGGLKRMWYLTPMGEEVATHLMAIEKALMMMPGIPIPKKKSERKKNV